MISPNVRRHSVRIAIFASCTLVVAAFYGSPSLLQANNQPTRSDVTGRVIDAATGTGIQDAVVSLSETGRRDVRRVQTSGDGAFTFLDAPTGPLRLAAAHPGYESSTLGQRFLGDESAPPPFFVADVRSGAVLKLFKLAVISGVVRDRDGRVLKGVAVRQFFRTSVAGHAQFAAGASVTTDINGEYRLFDLHAGSYLVGLGPSGGVSAGMATVTRESTTAFPMTFYPNAPSPSMAIPIELSSGDVRAGVDVTIGPERCGSLSGSLTGAEPRANTVVEASLDEVQNDFPVARTWTEANGHFFFRCLYPGTYVLRIRQFPAIDVASGRQYQIGNGLTTIGRAAGSARSSEDVPLFWADQQVSVVGGEATDNVTIALHRGARIAGNVEVKGSGLAPTVAGVAGSSIIVSRADGGHLDGLPLTVVGSKGEFVSAELPPGRYTLLAMGPSAMSGFEVNGLPATAVDVSGQDVTGVVVKLDGRPGRLIGMVQTDQQSEIREASVYVFPQDHRAWVDFGPVPINLVETRAGPDGSYSVSGMMPGEYFAVAVATGRRFWREPDFLEKLASQAVRVRIESGGPVTKNLPLARIAVSR